MELDQPVVTLPQQEIPKKKPIPWKKTILITLSFLIGIFALFFSYVMIRALFIERFCCVVFDEKTMLESPSPSLTPTNEKADWKTYTNDFFSFQYPSSFMLERDLTATDGAYINFITDDNVQSKMHIDVRTGEYVQQAQADLQKDLSSKRRYDYALSDISTKKINGQTFYVYTESFDFSLKKPVPPGGPISRLRADGMVQDVFYDISFEYEEKSLKQDQALFDQILSTFKFMDQKNALDTTNWKIYTIPNLLTFKYPPTYKVKINMPNVVVIADKEESFGPAQTSILIDARMIDSFKNYNEALNNLTGNKENFMNGVKTTHLGDIYLKNNIKQTNKYTTILFKYKEGAIFVTYGDDETGSRLYDQILSTFKFTQ